MRNRYKGVNEKFTFDENKIIEMMENYHNGINRQETMLYFVRTLNGCVNTLADKFMSNENAREDLVSIGNLAIMEELEDYNPVINGKFIRPTTFFMNRIKGAMQKKYLPQNITPHYNNIYRALRKASEENGIPLDSSEVTIEKFSRIINIDASAIRKAMEFAGMTVSSLDVMENIPLNEFTSSPEQMHEREELRGRLIEAISCLSKVEQFVFVNAANGVKYKEICLAINSNLSAFGLESPLTTQNIQVVYTEAKYKLEANEKLRHTRFVNMKVIKITQRIDIENELANIKEEFDFEQLDDTPVLHTL